MARPGLNSSRKFRRLAHLLGSQILARGALELLWDACYESVDDRLGTATEIEALVGWSGEPGALVSALETAGAPDQVGFIERVVLQNSANIEYKTHDLWDHAPAYVLKRRDRQDERRQLLKPGDKRRPSRTRTASKPDEKSVYQYSSVQSSTEQVQERTLVGVQNTPTSGAPPAQAGDAPPADTKVFLDWFQAEYTAKRQGAKYFVRWEKHAAIVKRLLKLHALTRLQTLASVLLDSDEEWIERTDRGIEVLSAKINWLEERLAAWEAKRRAARSVS